MKRKTPSRGERDPLRPVRGTRRRAIPVGLAALVVSAGALLAEGPSPAERVKGLLVELESAVEALERNLARQEAAWPARASDPASEALPPLEVRRLREEYDRILGQRDATLWQIRWAYSRGEKIAWLSSETGVDPGPLLRAIAPGEPAGVRDVLIPLVTDVAGSDPRTLDVLRRLALAGDTCPPAVSNGLARLGTPEAARFLLDLGVERSSLALLVAAVETGQPQVVEGLIDLAERGEPALATMAVRALGRVSPSDSRDRTFLTSLLSRRLERTQSEGLRTTLVVLLGLCRESSSVPVLEQVFSTSGDRRTRLAVVGAMGNIGAAAAPFLVRTLSSDKSPLAVRRGCAHALGVSRSRHAVPVLIERLDEPALRDVALRALERIAGQEIGESRGVWSRWWRHHGEAEPVVDPDDSAPVERQEPVREESGR